jgi:hypothetical protein
MLRTSVTIMFVIAGALAVHAETTIGSIRKIDR